MFTKIKFQINIILLFTMKFIFLYVIYVLVNCVSGYRILIVFPFPSLSHDVLARGYVRHLLEAGHQVTIITPMPMKNPPTSLRQIEVSSNWNYIGDTFKDMTKIMNKEIDLKNLWLLYNFMHGLTNATVFHPNVQKLINDPKEHFDIVVAEWMYSEMYSGFASVFGCPYIWSSSMEPHPRVLSLMNDFPNPAYTAENLSDSVAPFTFWERFEQFWMQLKIKYYMWKMRVTEFAVYNKAFANAAKIHGRSLAPLEVMMYNASMMLGNSHVSMGTANALPISYIHIGGYHVEDSVPLPKDLQSIMDNSTHGVIYFSMGSMLNSRTLPPHFIAQLSSVLGTLKHTVIWKFDHQLPNMAPNIHIVHWAPQPSILAHPNCVLFISHGGMLSITETIKYGVPIIGVPMYADQFSNVNRAVRKGFATKVDCDYNMSSNLKKAIDDMIDNPRYRQRAKEMSVIYHDRPVPPGRELVHWVQHVVKTGGAPHLRSPALMVPWYQKMYLDVAALVLIFILLIVNIIKIFFWDKNRDLDKKNK